MIPKIETKKCSDCGEVKIVHEFPKRYYKEGAVGSCCKACFKKKKPLSEIEHLRKMVPDTQRR